MTSLDVTGERGERESISWNFVAFASPVNFLSNSESWQPFPLNLVLFLYVSINKGQKLIWFSSTILFKLRTVLVGFLTPSVEGLNGLEDLPTTLLLLRDREGSREKKVGWPSGPNRADRPTDRPLLLILFSFPTILLNLAADVIFEWARALVFRDLAGGRKKDSFLDFFLPQHRSKL